MKRHDNLHQIRIIGRRMMDLTGNGPPTSGERIRQSLKLMKPHPRYTATGSIFISTCPNGDVLSAIIVQTTDARGYARETVRLVTATGCDPLSDGTDGDILAEFEASLFRLERGCGWQNHTADDIARMIAKLGRHLHFNASAESNPEISEDGSVVLVDGNSRTDHALGLMQGMMAYNGICGEEQEMHFFAATPLEPSELRLVNIEGYLSDQLELAFRLFDEPQLKVHMTGDKLFVCANGYAVNISTATPAEQAQFTAQIMKTLEKHGLSTALLRISNDQPVAA